MFVLGSFGNAFACWHMFVVKNNKQRITPRKPTKPSQEKALKILVSLIVADSMVCFLCLPLQALRMFHYTWTLSCSLEAVAFYLTIMSVWASSMTICFIAFDRLVLLTKYERYADIITERRIKIFMALCWTLSAIGPVCRFVPGSGGFKLFAPLNAVILLLPVVVLPISYYRIVRTFSQIQSKNHGNQQQQQQQQQQTEENIQREDIETCTTATTAITTTTRTAKYAGRNSKVEKVSRRCLLLIGNFFCCSITATVFMALLIMNEKSHFLSKYAEDLLTRFSFLGLTMNSCINPVIYVMRDKNFRNTLMAALCVGKKKNRRIGSVSGTAMTKTSSQI